VTYFSEYQGYVVNFRARQFQRLDDNNKVQFFIGFNTKLGMVLLEGFALYILNLDEMEGR